MGVFEMVVVVVAIVTGGEIAKAFAKRRPSAADQKRVQELEAQLQANEARLLQTEEKVEELSEKVGFVEALLESPKRSSRIPPPPA
jgi:chromosome segregation ATPase